MCERTPLHGLFACLGSNCEPASHALLKRLIINPIPTPTPTHPHPTPTPPLTPTRTPTSNPNPYRNVDQASRRVLCCVLQLMGYILGCESAAAQPRDFLEHLPFLLAKVDSIFPDPDDPARALAEPVHRRLAHLRDAHLREEVASLGGGWRAETSRVLGRASDSVASSIACAVHRDGLRAWGDGGGGGGGGGGRGGGGGDRHAGQPPWSSRRRNSSPPSQGRRDDAGAQPPGGVSFDCVIS
jgi:hypothetical protein